jgi:hypothetical protein
MRFKLSFTNAIEYVEIDFPAGVGYSLPANAILECGFN